MHEILLAISKQTSKLQKGSHEHFYNIVNDGFPIPNGGSKISIVTRKTSPIFVRKEQLLAKAICVHCERLTTPWD
jgi:D-ribose pyranose/furanose isomerase RbsD